LSILWTSRRQKQGGFAFLNEANTQRVERQKRTPITVIIGNPPYNMGQKSETENNKNRSYKVIDARIRETYAKDSTATLKNKYYDPYVGSSDGRWIASPASPESSATCQTTSSLTPWMACRSTSCAISRGFTILTCTET